ncbi:hypothetical protein AB0N61_10325 [Microbacterium sp. NPDC089320]|uniref:hypothetical protein n=1 Tax=Microbacterium sp. NPDC089320 TaxID=3155182 RepID=UPI00343084A9
MAAENYLFEYYGADFNIMIDVASGPATTTSAPNLRVVEGSWKTWRLDVDPAVSGLEGVRIRRCVSASGGEHPDGNLTPAESGPTLGNMLMVGGAGDLYQIAGGYGVTSRFYSAEEWAAMRAEWEASL